MARLIARANGNFTDSSTWALVHSGSMLDSESNAEILTTSWVESQSFTPGAITIDGIAVKIALMESTTPSGTMSVRLAQAGNTVPGTEVTINVSDIPPITSFGRDIGWYFFKFSSPVTLQAATAYTVSARTSVASQVSLYQSGPTGNWSRMLRTTTTQAPAVGDEFIITGEWTGAGSVTSRTVTMNDESGINYGFLDIGGYGKLTFSTDENKALKLHLDNADSHVRYNGELNIGTESNPIPRSSTVAFGINSPTASRGFYCYLNSVVTMFGQSRSSGKEAVSCFLTQNVNAGASTVYVDRDTGWKAGDSVALNGNVKGTGQAEVRTLASNAGSNSLTFTAGLSHAHYCTGDHKTEIMLLTQNVRVMSNNASYPLYIYVNGTFTSKFVLFFRAELQPRTGSSVTVNKCSGNTFNFLAADSGIVSFSIEDVVIYNIRSTMYFRYGNTSVKNLAVIGILARLIYFGATGAGQVSVDGYRCYNSASVPCYVFSHSGGTVLKNVEIRYAAVGQRPYVFVLDPGGYIDGENLLTYDCGNNIGNTVHIDGAGRITINGFYIRGHSYYFLTTSGTATGIAVIKMKNVTFKPISGNIHRYAIQMTGTTELDLEIDGLTIDESEASFTHGHVLCSRDAVSKIYFANVTGLSLDKCDLSGVASSLRDYIAIAIDASESLFAFITPYGSVRSDATIRRGDAGFSQRLVPISSTSKMKSGSKRAPVNAGSQITVNVYVRESIAGDGQDYNGSRPRLLVKRNPFVGISQDTVLATATSACEGAWEKLTGTTQQISRNTLLEFYVDCDGTQGWVNVDDWSVGD